MTRSLGSVWCGVALVSSLVGASGCNAIGRHKLESNLATAASGCRVKLEGSSSGVLKLSPCADGESTERARQYVMEHRAEIRALDVTVISIETWNAPRYKTLSWSSTYNQTCVMRCNGSGCQRAVGQGSLAAAAAASTEQPNRGNARGMPTGRCNSRSSPTTLRRGRWSGMVFHSSEKPVRQLHAAFDTLVADDPRFSL